MISRRAFNQLLAASSCMWPLWGHRRMARAQTPPTRRLLIVHTLATNIELWQPKSAAGQPIVFSDAHAALKPIADDVLLVDGLSPGNPDENHSTPQSLTGRGFGGQSWLSVDQFIAQTQSLAEPLLLGVQAGSESQFMDSAKSSGNNGRISPQDDPLAVFKDLFGAGPATTASSGASAGTTSAAEVFDHKNILDLVAQQLKAVRGDLGANQQKKIDQHLSGLARLQGGSGRAMPAAGCTPPAAPDLGGADAAQQAANTPVGEAHARLAVAAMGCGMADIVGIQWGISGNEYLSGTLNMELHSKVHSSGEAKSVIAGEAYLTDWFVRMIGAMKMTADPTAAGKTLFDTTLVMWTRDFGHQSAQENGSPGHANFAMPYILTGASDYLKRSPAGLYVKYAGDNRKGTLGLRHERLLYNLCEAMGMSQFQHQVFGSLAAGDRQPLPEIKK